MALDPRYVTAVSLDSPILDKVTGLPLVNGYIEFWADENRIFPKPVYQLTGTPPNYGYTALPNPLSLGPKGTPVDPSGNDVAVYAFPYDDFGNLELYFIQVFNSQNVPQFSRQAWPNVTPETEPGEPGNASLDNTLINSQFGFVDFQSPLTITVGTVTNQAYPIAPGWQLLVTATSGTITVTQTAVTGSTNLPGQPPYYLTISSSGSITQLILQQVLTANPNIFSQDFAGNGGWVNTSIALSPQSACQVYYTPNAGTSTLLLNASNVGGPGTWVTFNGEVQLPMGSNPNSGNAANTGINIVLTPGMKNDLTNVQVVYSNKSLVDMAPSYNEVPLIKQQGELMSFYQPLLYYKPQPSWLVGWDFPLNPAQLGTTFAATGSYGANKGFYTWDQTIVYQSVDNGVSVARGTNGGIVLTYATGVGQVALIQYLDGATVNKILQDRASVHLSGFTNAVGGLSGNVTLYAGTGTALPNVANGTNTTLIATIGANGIPATLNNPTGGTWTQVPNVFNNTSFELGAASTTNSESADIYLNGWDLAGASPANTATFFAIVVGFSAWASTNTITFNSIGLCSGDIATRPAPQTIDAVQRDCERYYEMSYSNFAAQATVPNYSNAVVCPQFYTFDNALTNNMYYSCGSYQINFKTVKRVQNPTITYKSPETGTAGNVFASMYINASVIASSADAVQATYWTANSTGSNTGDKYVGYFPANNLGGSIKGAWTTQQQVSTDIAFHYIVDARLGIV